MLRCVIRNVFNVKGLVIPLLIFVMACSPKAGQIDALQNQADKSDNIDFRIDMVTFKGDVQPFNVEMKVDTIEQGVYLLNLNLYTDFPSHLPAFELHIKYPNAITNSLWSARSWSTESYINFPNYSRLQSDYNIVSGLSSESNNRICFAVYDNFESRFTQIDIKQVPDSLVYVFNYFNEKAPDTEILEYNSEILVDVRYKNFSQVVREVAQWRLDKNRSGNIAKVDVSLKPVYSVWYPMDRNVPLDNITYYFDSIAAMGFRSVLFDDAWQNVVRFDVDKNGNWDPSSIQDVTKFIEKVKETRMNVALWYSKPFVGAHNYVFERFSGKYLQYRTSSQPILDIRYPEVRRYLTDMYTDIVSQWNVDGIWFDFLNGYYPDEQIIVTEDNGRDFVSVRKALDSLRSELASQMLYEKPELSINQSYKAAGPLHTSNTKTINGFLGTTVLGQIREKLVNNRILYGEYSPFMEVVGIHPKDPPIDIARKFHSVLFGVPYVSYFSYTLPEDVKETLKFWVRYWKSNVPYLLEADFKAYKPEQRYPVVWAGNERKNILVIYERTSPFDFAYFDFEMADVINSTDSEFIMLKGSPTGKVDYISYDLRGNYVNRGSLKFRKDIATLEIPPGGYANLIVK